MCCDSCNFGVFLVLGYRFGMYYARNTFNKHVLATEIGSVLKTEENR